NCHRGPWVCSGLDARRRSRAVFRSEARSRRKALLPDATPESISRQVRSHLARSRRERLAPARVDGPAVAERSTPTATDLLELLREANVPAFGVDKDAAMVEHCGRKGLSVEQADAFEFLRALEPERVGGIFCAEVIEHFEAADVVDLLDLCARSLRPGAALV